MDELELETVAPGDESTLTLQDNDQAPTEADEPELITLADGSQVTQEELLAGYMRNSDYTQKRQAEAERIRQIEAQVQQLAQPPQEEVSPADWLANAIGFDSEDFSASEVAMAPLIHLMAQEILDLKALVTKEVVQPRQASAAEQSFAQLLQSQGINASPELIRGAMAKANGNQTHAALILAGLKQSPPPAPPARNKPASGNGAAVSMTDMPADKMSDDDFAALRKSVMEQVG